MNYALHDIFKGRVLQSVLVQTTKKRSKLLNKVQQRQLMMSMIHFDVLQQAPRPAVQIISLLVRHYDRWLQVVQGALKSANLFAFFQGGLEGVSFFISQPSSHLRKKNSKLKL